MRRDEALKTLSAIENDLRTLISEHTDGNLDQATLHAAHSRTADLRDDIRRSEHFWLYDIAEPTARFLKVILQMAIGVIAVALISRVVLPAWHDQNILHLLEI